MRTHLRSVRMRVWMIALIAAAGVMAFTPLFNLLGFGFGFVMAILVSLASLDLGSALMRRIAAELHSPAADDADRAKGGWRLFVAGAAVHLCLLVAPLIVICVNGLRVRNCDWWFGAQAFVLMPVISCIGASWAGMLVGLACGRRRVLGNLAPYGVFLAAVLYAVWRFYAAPPVFSYNLFGGYFPGNLYDETIEFREPFYWARAYQFAILLTLLSAAILVMDRGRLALHRARALGRPRSLTRAQLGATSAALVSLVIAGWLNLESGRLGFDIDTDDIERHLGGRYDTEHFTIYYPRGTIIERDIHLIAEDHEFRFAQVTATLGIAPKARITSYYFGNAGDKYRMMGAGRVYMAKPWRSEIYLHHDGYPHQVVRHEVTHVIAGAFGSPLFKVSASSWLGLPVVFNVGMIEGIAVAADWPGRPRRPLTPHQSVKAMIEMGMAPPVERILSTGFLAFSSSRSYTLAGSLVRWLMDTEGADKIRELYRTGGDFRAVYGRSQAEMIRGWRAMIDQIELPPGHAELVRERFRRPSIFARPCPHAIARERVRLSGCLASGDVEGAVASAQKILSMVPGEPRYRLDLADMLVIAGRSEEAAEIYRDIRGDAEHISSTLRSEAAFELAKLAARAGDFAEVARLLSETDEMPLGENEQRYLDAMRFVASHRGPAGPALRDYFWRSDPRFSTDQQVSLGRVARAVLAEPELGLGHYLLGRNISERGAPTEVAQHLAKALDLGLGSIRLRRETARLLARAAYQANQLELVERAALIMLEAENPAVTQGFGIDWLKRVYWKRHGRLPTTGELPRAGR